MPQLELSFEAPAPPDVSKISEADVFTGAARAVLDQLPDDICIDDVLRLIGMEPHAIVAWHRARVIDALIGANGDWTAYRTNPGIRFKRRRRF